MEKKISSKFLKISTRMKVIADFYQDIDFKNYYDFISTQDEYERDLAFYKEYLDKDNTILEIGTGNGRIFNPLHENGFNIYGLEPSTAMTASIKKGKNKILKLYMQDIRECPITVLHTVIIPATSICLFSKAEFANFLIEAKIKYPMLKNVIFDFVEPEFFIETDDIVYKVNNKGDQYLYTNFIQKDQVIFNVIYKNKIGISQKYLYSSNLISEISKKVSITHFIIHYEVGSYKMCEFVY